MFEIVTIRVSFIPVLLTNDNFYRYSGFSFLFRFRYLCECKARGQLWEMSISGVANLSMFSLGKHSALIGDIEVEKVSDNESSDSEDEDRSAKFDFGPPLLFSGDSMDLDSLPDNIKSRMETITIRRQMVGKLG